MIFLRNRGITYLRIGEIESAGSDFNALLELGERHQVPLLQLEALINLGYVSDETGNLEEGLAYAEQAITLFSVNKGYFDDVEVKRALAFEAALRSHVKSKYKDLFDRIETTTDMNADDEKALAAAIEDFKKNGAY
jgi:tetratricopeptide (TPR) repeat protein